MSVIPDISIAGVKRELSTHEPMPVVKNINPLVAWRGCEARFGRSTSVLLGVLALLAVGFAIYLVEGGKPWDPDIGKRLDAGKKMRARDFGQIYSWWAALVNLVILTGALATARIWAGRGSEQPLEKTPAGPKTPPVQPLARRWVWLGLVSAVILAGWIRAPRLDHSFWNDEEYALRRYAWGEYDVRPSDGRLEFDPVNTADAFFLNFHGNNHLWHTHEARLFLAAWRWWNDSPTPEFSERAVRAIPFLLGLGSVLLVGVLGAFSLGRPIVGVGAAFLLAFSPWHVRYSVEARGYSSMLFWILAALVCLLKALETGRWRWWLGFAASQAIYLLCFAGSLYVALAVNLFVLGRLTWRWFRSGRRRIPGTGRWAAANLLGAIVVIQLALPTVPQILTYQHRADHQSNIQMNQAWFRDFGSHLLAGVPWIGDDDANDPVSRGTSTRRLAAANRLFIPWVLVLVPALALIGTIGMFAGGWRSSLVASATWGAGFISIAHNMATHPKMYGWYLLFLLIGFVLAAPWGAVWITGGGGGGGRFGRIPAIASVTVMIAGFAALTADPRRRLTRFDRQPIAAVVAHTRGEPHAFNIDDDGGILTGAFGVSDRQLFSYDPRVRIIREPDELKALIKEARSSGKQLYVSFCGQSATRLRHPDTFNIVTASGQFEKSADLPGLEAFFSYEIWRLKKQ